MTNIIIMNKRILRLVMLRRTGYSCKLERLESQLCIAAASEIGLGYSCVLLLQARGLSYVYKQERLV